MVSAETGGLPKAMAYDEKDHLITEISGTSQIRRCYDQNGEIIAASTDGSATEIRRAYSALGYPAQKRQGGTYNTHYTYSGTGRKTQQVTPSGRAEAYTYTPNGNLQSIATAGKMFSYAYYDNGLIQSVTYPNGLQTAYTYDAAGRVTAMETTGGGRTVTDTYTYNAAGALSTHNGKTYSYDAWDRLSGYTDGTASYTYKYDTDGLRTQKNDTQYVVDIHNNVIAEANESGSVTAETVWGHRPLARKTGDAWYYYLYNAHGDVIGLTDESGTVVNSYAYSPWGEIRTQTESVTNPIKYAGEYYDDELDMLYLRARYYDPQIGRFISLDAEKGSIQNPMDMNRYVYCRNNPIKYVDPTGNFFLQAAQAATNPYLHKLVWYTGAEIYLKNKGFLTSAWMLEHSLLSNPSNEYRGDSSRIAQLVKKDKSFLNALDLAISNSNGEKLNSKISVLFQEGDLYYSIHRCDIQLNGYKTSNGTWRVYGFLDDEYDYTEVLTWMEGNGASLGTIANDAAFISQIIGAIHPYHIYVHFVIER